jgi:hypothetical protein
MTFCTWVKSMNWANCQVMMKAVVKAAMEDLCNKPGTDFRRVILTAKTYNQKKDKLNGKPHKRRKKTGHRTVSHKKTLVSYFFGKRTNRKCAI